MCCSVLMIRTCCRCGAEFDTGRRALVCPACTDRTQETSKDTKGMPLTHRELQLVDLVRQGKANKECAYLLHLSEGTIKEYMSRIFHKLEFHSRLEVAIWAIDRMMEQMKQEQQRQLDEQQKGTPTDEPAEPHERVP